MSARRGREDEHDAEEHRPHRRPVRAKARTLVPAPGSAMPGDVCPLREAALRAMAADRHRATATGRVIGGTPLAEILLPLRAGLGSGRRARGGPRPRGGLGARQAVRPPGLAARQAVRPPGLGTSSTSRTGLPVDVETEGLRSGAASSGAWRCHASCLGHLDPLSLRLRGELTGSRQRGGATRVRHAIRPNNLGPPLPSGYRRLERFGIQLFGNERLPARAAA
jgi:hypothetical protein